MFLFPQNCDCVTLRGKRKFLDDVKDLKMEKLFWIMWVGPVLSQQPFKWEGEAGGFELEEKQSGHTCGTQCL